LIFCIVALVFANSVYNLVFDKQGNRPVAMNRPEAQPEATQTLQSFLNLEMDCDTLKDQETTASRVRLVGPYCGTGNDNRAPAAEGIRVVKTQIVNSSNQFTATIFTDSSSGKFSTDYIPLNPGKNLIRIDFVYEDGKNTTRELTLNKS